MPKFKATQAEVTAYKRSGLGTIDGYNDRDGRTITHKSTGHRLDSRANLPNKYLRKIYRHEQQEGQRQKLVAFLEKPNDSYGKQHIKHELTRHIRAGVSPGVLKDVYGFAWGAKDLTHTLHNESVWTMGTNSAGKTNFSHKYLPGYSLTNIPDNAYTSLAEVGKELIAMADGKRNSVTVDMPVVREQMSLLVYLLELLPRDRHWVIQAGPAAYTLTMQNRATLAAELTKGASEIELENNSSGLVVGFAISFNQIKISPAPYNKHKNEHPQGAFWAHLFQPELHPEFVKVWGEFGMFQTTDHKNYMTGDVHENCLIFALRSAGVSEKKVDQVRALKYSEMIPASSLEQAAHHIKTNLRVYIKSKKTPRCTKHAKLYPKDQPFDTTVELMLMDRHYFHCKKIPVTKYAMDSKTRSDARSCRPSTPRTGGASTASTVAGPNTSRWTTRSRPGGGRATSRSTTCGTRRTASSSSPS